MNEVYAALMRERYSRNTAIWWTRERPPQPLWDDSEVTVHRRRRELLAAASSYIGEERNGRPRATA